MEHSLDIADSSVVMSNKGPTHAEAPPSPGSPSGSDDEQPRGRKRFRSGDFASGGGVALDHPTGSQVSPSSPASFWTSYFSSCLGRRHDCRPSWCFPGSQLGDSGTVCRFSTSPEAGVCPRRGANTLAGDQWGWIVLNLMLSLVCS